jgi:hypothetical protein
MLAALTVVAGSACGKQAATSAEAAATPAPAEVGPNASPPTGPEAAPRTPAETEPDARTAAPPSTPNAFYAAGTPTFVLGTAGDDPDDRAIAAQVELVRGLFEGATAIADTSFDPAAGPDAWPDRPVLYGRPDQNAALATVAEGLPFRLEADGLTIAGVRFGGPGIRLIAAVPAHDPRGARPGHPAFLLYAGTGPSGIAEINGVFHGNEPILVADVFGRLATGRWVRDAAGEWSASLDRSRTRRIAWRAVERPAGPTTVTFRFPAMLDPNPGEEATITACLAGIATVLDRLAIADPVPLDVYVHPDRRSKESLTGDAGDGHAVPSSRALHVIAAPPEALEPLVAHEATHVLGYEAWGPVATSLIGEGLAVWASGAYGGVPLSEWAGRIRSIPDPVAWMGPAFRRLPEAETYPAAGLLVQGIVFAVGIDAFRDHLLGATAETWVEACGRAGTTPEALRAAWKGATAN